MIKKRTIYRGNEWCKMVQIKANARRKALTKSVSKAIRRCSLFKFIQKKIYNLLTNFNTQCVNICNIYLVNH